MKKYIFLDFDGEISQMKRWFYGVLKFIAVYILMVMLFMAYFYWYPEKEMNNMNRRALMTKSVCVVIFIGKNNNFYNNLDRISFLR